MNARLLRAAPAVLGVLAMFACREEKPRPAEAKEEPIPREHVPVNTSTVPRTVYASHFSMGSQTTITAYTADEVGADRAFADAFKEMERLDGLLTVWRDTSDVSK